MDDGNSLPILKDGLVEEYVLPVIGFVNIEQGEQLLWQRDTWFKIAWLRTINLLKKKRRKIY